MIKEYLEIKNELNYKNSKLTNKKDIIYKKFIRKIKK